MPATENPATVLTTADSTPVTSSALTVPRIAASAARFQPSVSTTVTIVMTLATTAATGTGGAPSS